MNRPVLRAFLRWAGRVLALLGLVFVALRLRADWGEVDLGGLGWSVWAALGGLALVYGGAGVMLGLAWGRLLAYFGAAVPRRWAVGVYGLSQISKYVPGNVFHLAARQGRGMAAGIGGWPLAKSAAWELGLLAGSGALFGLLALPLVVETVPGYAAAGLFAVTVVVATLALGRVIGPPVAAAFAWQTAFLLVSGLTFLGVLALLDTEPAAGITQSSVLGAYIVAWLAGLLTPGSPAGLGVRELVLLVLLEGAIPDADLLEAVLLARGVSVLGDAVFFAAALGARPRLPAGSPTAP